MNHPLCRPRAVALLVFSALLLGDAAVTPAPLNRLFNGSFESGGEPSLAGWQAGNPDLASAVSPGAPGGGNWALQLEADWAPTLGFVTQRIEGLQDGDIVELRADVKAMNQDGGGMIRLLVGDSPWGARAKWAASSSGTWTTLSVVDTLDHVRAREHQKVVVALQILRVRFESLATEVRFHEALRLDHRAERPVDDEHALFRELSNFGSYVTVVHDGSLPFFDSNLCSGLCANALRTSK
jgi:hypothetical protein